jgi:hypothetical protein
VNLKRVIGSRSFADFVMAVEEARARQYQPTTAASSHGPASNLAPAPAATPDTRVGRGANASERVRPPKLSASARQLPPSREQGPYSRRFTSFADFVRALEETRQREPQPRDDGGASLSPRILEGRGIPAIPYKGPVLAASLYEDLAVRPFSDLDILIKRKDVLKAMDLMTSLGYRPHYQLTHTQVAAFLKSKYEFPLTAQEWMADGGAQVESSGGFLFFL